MEYSQGKGAMNLEINSDYQEVGDFNRLITRFIKLATLPGRLATLLVFISYLSPQFIFAATPTMYTILP